MRNDDIGTIVAHRNCPFQFVPKRRDTADESIKIVMNV